MVCVSACASVVACHSLRGKLKEYYDHGSKKTAKMKEKEYPRAARMIINNTYLDNIVNSMNDQDEANNLVRQINHILNHG